MNVGRHLKGIVSAAVSGAIAFLSSLLTALQGENTGFGTVTDGQWVTAFLAALVAVGASGGVTHRVADRGAAVDRAPAAPEPVDVPEPAAQPGAAHA